MNYKPKEDQSPVKKNITTSPKSEHRTRVANKYPQKANKAITNAIIPIDQL